MSAYIPYEVLQQEHLQQEVVVAVVEQESHSGAQHHAFTPPSSLDDDSSARRPCDVLQKEQPRWYAAPSTVAMYHAATEQPRGGTAIIILKKLTAERLTVQ
eukprot:scaffold86521_cov21-Tisochrysis_lutea.AAC.2